MRQLLILTVVLLGGCASIAPANNSPRFVHIVILWLKNPGNAADRQTLVDTSRNFVGKIPGLVSVSAGNVLPSARPVVDSTYDVGVVMVFDSKEAFENYPSTAAHQHAMKEVLGPLVDHYRVYDFTEK
jgi:hypothetical protein